MTSQAFKICVVGAGQFSGCFVPLFRAHPGISEVSLCEIDPERLSAAAKSHHVVRTFSTFEDVLKSDVEALAIFTQRHTHARLALEALRAGKHVYCAVPAATSLEELQDLVDTVKATGLTYMMGETSQYYGATVFCREKWQQGAFGHFVYGEGEYLHDMSHGFYEAFQYSGGPDWKRVASFPPMLYPTHSVAMVLAVTGARMTRVSCYGFRDRETDGIFQEAVSLWKNPFSNQSALFQTSDGGMARINEFRRVGLSSKGRSVRCRLFGTLGSFEEMVGGAVWSQRDGFIENVEAKIRCGAEPTPAHLKMIELDPALQNDFVTDYAEVHQPLRHRLPREFNSLHTGHEGSHQFLVDDFVKAVVHGHPPPVHVWQAARYNAPGLVAHVSCQKEGESLSIPDFGWPTPLED
jgi:predicted dehydrogenase